MVILLPIIHVGRCSECREYVCPISNMDQLVDIDLGSLDLWFLSCRSCGYVMYIESVFSPSLNLTIPLSCVDQSSLIIDRTSNGPPNWCFYSGEG